MNGSGRSITFVLICIFGGAPREMAAQEPLGSGSRVRVTALDCGLRGGATEFRALRADTLVLEATECPLASVTRFDVNRGQKSNASLGVAIGLPAGALGAIVYCKAVDVTGCHLFDDDLTPVSFVGSGLGLGRTADQLHRRSVGSPTPGNSSSCQVAA